MRLWTLATFLRKTLQLKKAYHPITPAGRDFRDRITRFSQAFGDGNTKRGGNDAELDMANCQPFFDPHANHIPGGEAGCISKDIQQIVQVFQDRGDGQDEDGGLKKAQDPGNRLLAHASPPAPAGYRGSCRRRVKRRSPQP